MVVTNAMFRRIIGVIIILPIIFNLYYSNKLLRGQVMNTPLMDIPSLVSGNAPKIDSDQVNISKAAAIFSHTKEGWCRGKEDHLIKIRADWNETRDGPSCPSYVRDAMLKGIPNDSMVFVVGDSLARMPVELLCARCGINSCNHFGQRHPQGCELERGIKVVIVPIRYNMWSQKMKLEKVVTNMIKSYLSFLYQPVNSEGKVAVDLEMARKNYMPFRVGKKRYPEPTSANDTMVPSSQQALPIPEWLKWLQTSDINTPFPTSCGDNKETGVSCPKLFIVTNLSTSHNLYLDAKTWAAGDKKSHPGDFSAFIKTFDRITNEKNFADKIGGQYVLSTGTYICESKRGAKITNVFKTAVDECKSYVSVEGPHLSMIKEHIRSGNPPRLIDEKHYNHKSQDGISASNITTERVQEAIVYACEHGVQNNYGTEWYSALVSTIARKKKIPIVDAWNLTKGEVESLAHIAECAATKDGLHYKPDTMWKQLRLWFELFSR